MNNTTSNNNIDGTAGALYVKGGTRLDGSLNVMGETYFKGAITFIGAVTSLAENKNAIISVTSNNINNNMFTYDGIPLNAVDKTSKFNINGGANFNDSISVSNTIYGNKINMTGDVSFNSNAFISSNLYLDGDASLNNDLFVSGVTTLGTTNNTGIPLYVDGSGAMRIPVGASGERPSVPEIGYIRYNTDDTTFEGWGANGAWGSLGGVSNPDKTTQVYVGDTNEIVFKTDGKIRETIDNSGNVLFDLSNNQGYGKIKMRQDLSATVLQVSDSSNNNHISIQNQGAFKLIYDQSSAITNSQMEMKDNEIILYPSYPEPALTSNSNGVMIGYDNTLYNQLNDMYWNRIGYKDIDGTKLGNTVSISRNGKRVAFGEYEVNSTDVSSNVHIYNVFEREIVHLDTIKITGGNVSSIDLNEDGTRIIIGKYNAVPNGQIELWEYNGSIYQQVGILQSGSMNESQLGHTTSINNDGTIFAAGQYTSDAGNPEPEGGVLIFQCVNESTINKIADISMNNGGAVDQYQQMGRSIELNGAGDRIIIGGTIDKTGTSVYRVYVYQKQTDDSWDQVLDITNTTDVGKNFGLSVAMSNDGNVISIATQEKDTADEIGQVLVYDLLGDGLTSSLTSSLRGSPITFDGIDNEDTFGASMSLNDDGSVLAIGSGALGNFNGKAFIYKYLNSDWTTVANFDGGVGSNMGGIHDYDGDSGKLVSDEDGIGVEGTGELVIIGAPNFFKADMVDGPGNGQVYLYKNQTYTLGVNKKLRFKGE